MVFLPRKWLSLMRPLPMAEPITSRFTLTRLNIKTALNKPLKIKAKKAMEPYTAYMITDILKDVITKGTGFKAQIPNLFQAGKTGTSNYTTDELAKIPHYGTISPDVMFTGFTPHFSLSIWAGYDDRMKPITSQSEYIAQDVYREMMSYASENVSNEDWVMPDDVLRIGNELYVKGATSVPMQPSYSVQSSYYNNYFSTTGSSSGLGSETSVSESSTVAPPVSSEAPSSTPTPSSSVEPQPSQPSSSASQPDPAPTPAQQNIQSAVNNN